MVVVEHDEETIRRAEHVIDLGPGAGVQGGRMVAQGTAAELAANPDSVTGRYLARPAVTAWAGAGRGAGPGTRDLAIKGRRLHNLKGLDLRLPLARLVCVTGVSGSGKSSLVREVLVPSLRAAAAVPVARWPRRRAGAGCTGAVISGWQALSRVLEVDQTPIGKTPRSCPATYVGFWDPHPQALRRDHGGAHPGLGGARASPSTPPGGAARPARARACSAWR